MAVQMTKSQLIEKIATEAEVAKKGCKGRVGDARDGRL